MILPKLPNWLQDPISKAWHNVSEKCWTAMEDAVIRVFKSARIDNCTDAALDILWEDAPVTIPLRDDLKRNFLKNYNIFMENVGTQKGDQLTKDFFGLTKFESVEMRDVDETYPFHVIRFTIGEDAVPQMEDIESFLKIILPARCIMHFQTSITYVGGFLRRNLKRRFTRK